MFEKIREKLDKIERKGNKRGRSRKFLWSRNLKREGTIMICVRTKLFLFLLSIFLNFIFLFFWISFSFD